MKKKKKKKKKSIILPSVIPVRFPADEELAAAMRALPVMRLARALARWVGDEPIPIADGWQAPETKLDAARALGLVAEDGTLTDEITRRVNWIYEITFHAVYLHTEHGAVHRHHGLDTATEQTDAQIRTAWDGALNALFAHGVEDLLPAAANPAPLDFHGIGNFPLLAMLEQHGTATVAELSGEIALGATEGMTPSAAEHAWAAWTSKHDDPTRGYLGLAEGLGVLRIDGETATLTPLGTWAMLRQLHNAHLEHLPDSAELTPYQVLVCRLGISGEAFARELECWLTAREPGSAVTELLTEAAAQGDSPRYLRTAVQIAAGISGDTHVPWACCGLVTAPASCRAPPYTGCHRSAQPGCGKTCSCSPPPTAPTPASCVHGRQPVQPPRVRILSPAAQPHLTIQQPPAWSTDDDPVRRSARAPGR